MQKRVLGRNGLEVGVVGLGCEGLLGKDREYLGVALDMMEKAGASLIDLYSPNPDMRSALGFALAGRREKFALQMHICAVWHKGQYKRSRNIQDVKEGFEDQLKRLNTDYADIGMIHYVDSLADWEGIVSGPVMSYALELKKAGTVRNFGISSHNPVVALKAVESGLLDTLLFSINPCYDLQPPNEDVEQLWNREKYKSHLLNMDSDRVALYEKCQSMGVGISVMKAFGGGDLLKADQSLAKVALTVDQCIAYALDRPAVACVLAGAHSLEELEISLNFANATPRQKDYAEALASFPDISWKGHCMYCGHCAPCPVGIDVAALTKLLNLALSQTSVPETVAAHYQALPHKAAECSECGACETRCPFEVKVRKNMAKAREIFGE